ncbi:hypothetical protein ACFQ1M_15910 [Sungkyunkwania multivorans]|uniref:Uncharacterized protein n=1 Tax=Sungkyunkwania multivorans TaxID=1173618 RepID=A0ABW3D3R9_9FLAO
MKNTILPLLVGFSSFVMAQEDADVPSRQFFGEDVFVQGSLMVGSDTQNNAAFGFDTVILRENNLRMLFDDTSASGSFPSNDWRFTFNSSDNGGDNYFSIDDATANAVPFRIDAGAGNNAFRINNAGNVGIGTASPVVELHVADGDSPALRLEQNNTSGFTPQIWDLAGNETNFFVRDVTNGSALPFRIQPGNATDDALMIKNNGSVGIQAGGNFNAINANASLHLGSNSKGLLLNRLTTAQRTTLGGNLGANQSGMIVYDLEETQLYIWDGTQWVVSDSDDQQLTFASPFLSISEGNSVDLTPLLADLESRVTALETATSPGTDLTPEKFNYQLAVRDNSGAVLAGQNVSFRISILDDPDFPTFAYVETHAVTTNTQGVATMMVGDGVVLAGVFADIDWAASAHYLIVEVDASGGSNYVNVGSTQLVSVPYALHAKSAESVSGVTREAVQRLIDRESQLGEALNKIRSLEAENISLRDQLKLLSQKVDAILKQGN